MGKFAAVLIVFLLGGTTDADAQVWKPRGKAKPTAAVKAKKPTVSRAKPRATPKATKPTVAQDDPPPSSGKGAVDLDSDDEPRSGGAGWRSRSDESIGETEVTVIIDD